MICHIVANILKPSIKINSLSETTATIQTVELKQTVQMQAIPYHYSSQLH